MLAAGREVHFTCALQKAGHQLIDAIHEVATVLTGRKSHFAGPGSGATDGQRAEIERWNKIERGDLPWPR
jgi:hypothetical protein